MKTVWNVSKWILVVAFVVLTGAGVNWWFKANDKYEDYRLAHQRTELELAEASFPIPRNTLLVSTDGEKCRVEVWTTVAVSNPHLSYDYTEGHNIDDVRVVVFLKQPTNPKIRRVVGKSDISDYLLYDSGSMGRLVSSEIIPIPNKYTHSSGDPKHQWKFAIKLPEPSKFEWRVTGDEQVAKL